MAADFNFRFAARSRRAPSGKRPSVPVPTPADRPWRLTSVCLTGDLIGCTKGAEIVPGGDVNAQGRCL